MQRQQVIESERGQLLAAAALRDLKAILVAELRKTTPPKVRTVDVVWNLEEQRLAIYTHAKSMNEALLALFSQTFNLGLDIEGPALWAKEQSEGDAKLTAQLKAARPTLELLHGFVGLRPTPHGHEAVSYTHLDVYKRQMRNFIDFHPGIAFGKGCTSAF